MKNETIFAILLIANLLTVPSCSEKCDTDAVRCDGDTLEQCHNGEWQAMVHCVDAVGDDYACCEVKGLASCYLRGECNSE